VKILSFEKVKLLSQGHLPRKWQITVRCGRPWEHWSKINISKPKLGKNALEIVKRKFSSETA
jgi:hypothetical protein